MLNLVDNLKKYFNETPRDNVLSDWKKSERFDDVGITVTEFLANKNVENIKNHSVDNK